MNYEELSKEELIKEIQKLHREKTYGLIWEDKPEKVDEEMKTNYPVLTELPTGLDFDEDKPVNLLIEGDNLHSLYLLKVTHNENIDCILIDPPYNTGNKDFIYNDEYVDKEDSWRHSKWVSFMYKRLRIARDLLKEDGVIFIHIDENEFAQLKLLCDEIFNDKNFIGAFVWKGRSGKGGTNVNLATEHEYIYCYAKNIEKANFKSIINEGKERREQLRQWGQAVYRENRKSMFFPLLYKEENDQKSTITDNEYNKLYNIEDDELENYLDELRDKYEAEGWNFILPRINGRYGRWRAGRNKIIELLNETNEDKERIVFSKDSEEDDAFKPYRIYPGDKETESAFGSLILDKGTASDGTKELKMIFKDKVFDTTKPLDLTMFLIDLAMFNKEEGVVLDFFAGSGTTGEAVLKLNETGGKNINFILCTNNEMKEQTRNALLRRGITEDMDEYKNEGVCRKVTLPKLKAVINGYEYIGKVNETLAEFKINKTFVNKINENSENITSLIEEKKDDYKSIKVKVVDEKMVIFGENEVNGFIEGIPANLKYYMTDKVPKNKNKDQMKMIMANKIFDLLCIKENCFTLKVDNPHYKIYKNNDKVVGIYSFFMETYIDDFKEALNNIEANEKVIYSFSFNDYIKEELFSDLDDVKVKPIPSRILEILNEITK